MLWPAENLSGLIAVALVCGCAADERPPSREDAASAEPMPGDVARSPRTRPAGMIASTLRSRGRPFGIAVSVTGMVYCTLLDAASLVRTTVQADSLTAVPVDQVPTDVAFSPDGHGHT